VAHQGSFEVAVQVEYSTATGLGILCHLKKCLQTSIVDLHKIKIPVLLRVTGIKNFKFPAFSGTTSSRALWQRAQK
jgi:hypothetical protein